MNRELVFLQRDIRTWEVCLNNALKGVLYHAFDGFEMVVFEEKRTHIYPICKGDISDAQRIILNDRNEYFKKGDNP